MFVLLIHVLVFLLSRLDKEGQLFARADSELCEANFSAKNYSSGSVLLYWEFLRCENIVNPIEVSCTEEHHYITSNNEPAVDEKQVDHFLTPISGEALIQVTQHARYSCRAFVHQNGQTVFKTEFFFQSEVGAPNPPPTPVVIPSPSSNLLYLIKLYNSSTYNGPISGYEVQFHVIDMIPVDHFSYLVIPEDHYRPRGSIPTMKNAQGSTTPVPFSIHYQSVGNLPKQIYIDQSLLGGALKKGAMYIVVVTAYYEKQPNRTLFSYSNYSEVVSIPQENETNSTFQDIEKLSDNDNFHQHTLPILIVLSFFALFLIIVLCIIGKKLKQNRKRLRNLCVVSVSSIPPDACSHGKFPNAKLPQIHGLIIYPHYKRPKLNFLKDKKKSAFNEDWSEGDIAASHLHFSCPHISPPPNTSVKDSLNTTEVAPVPSPNKASTKERILPPDSAMEAKVCVLSDSNTLCKPRMSPHTTQCPPRTEGSMGSGKTQGVLDLLGPPPCSHFQPQEKLCKSSSSMLPLSSSESTPTSNSISLPSSASMLSSAPLPVICRIAKKYNPNAATITTDNSNNINPPISGREQRKSQISTGVMNASSREVGLLPRSTVRTPMMSFSLESMIDPTSSHDLLHTSKSWSSALSSPSSTVVKPDGDDLHVVVGLATKDSSDPYIQVIPPMPNCINDPSAHSVMVVNKDDSKQST